MLIVKLFNQCVVRGTGCIFFGYLGIIAALFAFHEGAV